MALFFRFLAGIILPGLFTLCTLFIGGCDLAKPLNKVPEKPAVVQTVPAPLESPKPAEPVRPVTTTEPAPLIPAPPPTPTVVQENTPTQSDRFIANLYANQKGDVQVRGIGTVTRILADDNKGDRHQRFILTLGIGQTLLIAHNIDIAPRLNGITVGDKVEFFGEYYYNDKGGGIHWTHRDLRRRHVDGWLKWNGKVFQ